MFNQFPASDGHAVEVALCAAHGAQFAEYVAAKGLAVVPRCLAGQVLVRIAEPDSRFADWDRPCREPGAQVLNLTDEDGTVHRVPLCVRHAVEIDLDILQAHPGMLGGADD